MFYAISWLIVLGLLALWSLLALSVHALGAWTVSSAGSVADAATAGNVARVSEWLTSFTPAELVMSLSSLVASLSLMLSNLPNASPVITYGWAFVILIIWAIGSLALLALGVLAHTLKARWRRPGSLPTHRTAEPQPT